MVKEGLELMSLRMLAMAERPESMRDEAVERTSLVICGFPQDPFDRRRNGWMDDDDEEGWMNGLVDGWMGVGWTNGSVTLNVGTAETV